MIFRSREEDIEAGYKRYWAAPIDMSVQSQLDSSVIVGSSL